VVFDIFDLGLVRLGHLEESLNVIWLIVLDQLVQDGAAAWKDVVEHGLDLGLVDFIQLESALAD
jgi:hypothetical protein